MLRVSRSPGRRCHRRWPGCQCTVLELFTELAGVRARASSRTLVFCIRFKFDSAKGLLAESMRPALMGGCFAVLVPIASTCPGVTEAEIDTSLPAPPPVCRSAQGPQ